MNESEKLQRKKQTFFLNVEYHQDHRVRTSQTRHKNHKDKY